jgi:hypothetical protein
MVAWQRSASTRQKHIFPQATANIDKNYYILKYQGVHFPKRA